MQSFSLILRWRSASVSLPSLPRWDGVSEVEGLEELALPEDFADLLSELFPFSFDLLFESEVPEEFPFEAELEEVAEFLVCREISDLRSQYLASMVWARVR